MCHEILDVLCLQHNNCRVKLNFSDDNMIAVDTISGENEVVGNM